MSLEELQEEKCCNIGIGKGRYISLCKPLNIRDIPDCHIPEELLSLLKQTDGIKEIMINPSTGMSEEISWIIYSFEMIIERTNFYREAYSIEGVVFSDDGADAVYSIKSNGKIYSYDAICRKETCIADSLQSFLQIAIRGKHCDK